ncbi:MAG: exonuclease domain-containing protein [Ruminococcus sp.]|nr:exonuclease domain-containing protein [Ruminococcus sp.]
MPEKYISFDLEMPSNESRISAIGITVIENGIVTDRFYSLVNPETEFEPFIVNLIGITPEMVADKPTFPEIWGQIKDLMSGGILVAYNAPSDLRVLSECMKSYGIEWCETVQFLCTYEMGLVCYPQLEGHTLDILCAHRGINLNHHHAGSDSYGCAMLLLDYIESGLNVESYIKTYDMLKSRINRPVLTWEEKLRKRLFSAENPKIKQKVLARFPYLEEEKVIGVEIQRLRKIANELHKSNRSAAFIGKAPHQYHEENNLHAMLISRKKKFSTCIEMIDEFLPLVDNIETCELIHPALFTKKQPELKAEIMRWLSSDDKFTIVFGMNMLNRFYIDTEHLPEFLAFVSQMRIKSPAVATRRVNFFLLALEHDFNMTFPYLASGGVSKKVLSKVVSSAVKNEAYSDDQKHMLSSILESEQDKLDPLTVM